MSRTFTDACRGLPAVAPYILRPLLRGIMPLFYRPHFTENRGIFGFSLVKPAFIAYLTESAEADGKASRLFDRVAALPASLPPRQFRLLSPPRQWHMSYKQRNKAEESRGSYAPYINCRGP